MLKKHYKKGMAILFLGVVLFTGILVASHGVTKNLCNIDYHYMLHAMHLGGF